MLKAFEILRGVLAVNYQVPLHCELLDSVRRFERFLRIGCKSASLVHHQVILLSLELKNLIVTGVRRPSLFRSLSSLGFSLLHPCVLFFLNRDSDGDLGASPANYRLSKCYT